VHIVLAGHSAGAQIVQRYAAVARGDTALAQAGIALRFVVANPSSYLYFSADRPRPAGGFAPFDGAADCPGFDRWKYGLAQAPAYVASQDPAAIERRYAEREVVYLLGTADNNPNHPLLDRSCAGRAQGKSRYERGIAYFDYLQRRDGAALRHRLVEVPGIGHNNRGMFTSPAGLSVLLDRPAG
jgi:hypothetical protein